MQTAWVAGGAGFIGRHLCRELLSSFNVLCIDNLITGSEDNIKDLKSNPNFKFINQDIISSKLPSVRADYIFHLASPASPNAKSRKSYIAYPIETLKTNSFGTYNLLEIARKTQAKFLFASTSEIYGDPAISPQREDYWGNVNPLGIRSVYDEGKRFSEAFVMAYVRKYNVDARIVRIFNTYGPGMQIDDGRVVSNFVTQAIQNKPVTIYGNGRQTRSFCYVSDMSDGIKKAMFSKNTKGEAINLGNPVEKNVSELGKLIKRLTDSKSEIVFEDLPEDDPKQRKPDITKAKRLLEWEPKVGLEEGLRRTIEYFRKILMSNV